jgi:hypothetical protein
MQLVSQCLKKDFDNALQEVFIHAAMIFMQLATIGDRGIRRDWGEALYIWRQILIKVKRVLG